jgi:hypothetical protein
MQYDNGDAYIVGTVGGRVRFLYLCTGSGSTNDCNSQGTSRNMAMALTALTSGKIFQAYFREAVYTSCDQIPDGVPPSMFRLVK